MYNDSDILASSSNDEDFESCIGIRRQKNENYLDVIVPQNDEETFNQNSTGQERKFFPFYVEMQEVLGKKTNVHPEILLVTNKIHSAGDEDHSDKENIPTPSAKNTQIKRRKRKANVLTKYQEEKLTATRECNRLISERNKILAENNRLIKEMTEVLRRSCLKCCH